MKNHILNRSEGKNSTTGWAQTIGLIAFDADDTLWDNQGHFNAVEKAYCSLLSPYGTAEQVSAALFETETANMPLLGYGCKAFTLSLIENAVSFSKGQITAQKTARSGAARQVAALSARHAAARSCGHAESTAAERPLPVGRLHQRRAA